MLLARLGAEGLERRGVVWQRLPRSGPRAGCLYFAETAKNVCDQEPGEGFMTFWGAHGLLDPSLDARQRGLALLGLPLTEARSETNPDGATVLTQWFERARLEWHPANPAGGRVLPGLLGRESRPVPRPAPAVVGTIPLPASPYAVGVDPARGRLYVTSLATRPIVTIIDEPGATVTATVPTLAIGTSVLVDPTADRAFVVNSSGGAVFAFPVVSIVDGASPPRSPRCARGAG